MSDDQGYLTTHVLDTARGCPAAGIAITLFAFQGDTRREIATTVTNDDGRTDQPILPKGHLKPGVYELVFDIGAYFGAKPGGATPFLDRIPLRFGIEDATQHYHVPLLVSPFSYSTYRGS
ncbi:MAG: hydroxyisourate hydrolase [Magnetospiraceae bacterium]